jgi:hypothetical protein
VSDDVPYDRIIRKVADRLGMTVGQVDAVMTAYEQESRADKERLRAGLEDNHVYQQWKAAKAKTSD